MEWRTAFSEAKKVDYVFPRKIEVRETRAIERRENRFFSVDRSTGLREEDKTVITRPSSVLKGKKIIMCK